MKKLSLKVCFISCILPVDDTRVFKFYSVLVREGFDVWAIMAPPRNSLLPSEVGYCQLAPIRHFLWGNSSPLNVLLVLMSRSFNMIKSLFHILKLHPDIIHCHEPDSWIVAIIAKWLYRSKVVVDFQETYDTRANAFPLMFHSVIRTSIRKGMRFLSGHTDYLIHVSHTRQSLYPDFRCETIVISHYADLTDFDLTESYVPDPRFVGRFVVVHAGALRVSYASAELLQALVEARRLVPNLLCIVLGGVAGSTLTFDSDLQELQNDGTLLIFPFMPIFKVFQYLRQCHVGLSLILPVDDAHRFAFPRKFFEYLAVGLPIIGSDVVDIRNVNEEWKCGLVVDARQPSAIACAIIELAKNDSWRSEMARNARQAAIERFNWDNEASKLIGLYAKLAAP